jgi:twinkle protein
MATFAEHGIRVQVPGAEEQKTTCPRCSETRRNKTERCLSVNTIKGIWLCHHCQWSGSLDGKSHRRIEWAALPSEKLPKPMPNPLREKLIEYFAGRSIPADVLGRNNVTMEERFVAATGKEERCIAFAYYVDGSVVNVKYRDARKNFTQTKDGGRIFYKIDDAKDQAEVIICEGEIDALSWEVAGYRNAISVPDGAPAPTASNVAVKMRFLDNAADRLEHVERFVIATDNDPAGKRLEQELVRRLGVERCWLVKYPSDCKDTNDVLTKYGADAVRRMFDDRQPYPIEGSFRVGDVYETLVNIYEHGYPEIAGCGDGARWLRVYLGTGNLVPSITSSVAWRSSTDGAPRSSHRRTRSSSMRTASSK